MIRGGLAKLEGKRMFFLFLGFSLSLASTALAGCPDVGIAAVFSDRYSGNIGCVAQNNMPLPDEVIHKRHGRLNSPPYRSCIGRVREGSCD